MFFDKIMILIKNKLLKKNGKLFVLGYYPKGLDIIENKININKKSNIYF